ncbi:MAG TPA: hydroxymethylbilane synthase [Acidobacteriota bacterium]|nr:hydroxymethylbilane synthase [Acidobacteriota bacterium]
MKIRIGSRGSNLAMWQARWVSDQLCRLHIDCEIVIIRTTGDANLNRFSAIFTKGMFIKEIEEALLRGEIDLAVHSLKDVPTALPNKLILAAIPERDDPADVLIAADGVTSIATLAENARVGTSSPRRVCQLRALRPDIQVQDIRGNVETRINKVERGEVDAVVLALAGVRRLGLNARISAKLGPEEILPAPGQGALVVEMREENLDLKQTLRYMDHAPTRSATDAERLLLEKLGGGCRVPLGALALWQGNSLRLQAVIGRPDGSEILRGEVTGSSPGAVAEEMAEFFLARGVKEWLQMFA